MSRFTKKVLSSASVPLTLPNDTEALAYTLEGDLLGGGSFSQLSKCSVWVDLGGLRLLWETGTTPVPQTPMKFVNRVGTGIVPVCQLPCDTDFPAIVGMTNKIPIDAWSGSVGVRTGHPFISFQFVCGILPEVLGTSSAFFPSQPLERFDGLIGACAMPTTKGSTAMVFFCNSFFRQ